MIRLTGGTTHATQRHALVEDFNTQVERFDTRAGCKRTMT
jgi:hypothetical protein